MSSHSSYTLTRCIPSYKSLRITYLIPQLSYFHQQNPNHLSIYATQIHLNYTKHIKTMWKMWSSLKRQRQNTLDDYKTAEITALAQHGVIVMCAFSNYYAPKKNITNKHTHNNFTYSYTNSFANTYTHTYRTDHSTPKTEFHLHIKLRSRKLNI